MLPRQQGQGTENWLTEASSVDANGAVETIRKRLSTDGPPDRVGEPGQIRKTDGEVYRNGRLGQRGQRQPERKARVGRFLLFEKQRALQAAERQAERIGVGDPGPESNTGAAERKPGCGAEQPTMVPRLGSPQAIATRRRPSSARL